MSGSWDWSVCSRSLQLTCVGALLCCWCQGSASEVTRARSGGILTIFTSITTLWQICGKCIANPQSRADLLHSSEHARMWGQDRRFLGTPSAWVYYNIIMCALDCYTTINEFLLVINKALSLFRKVHAS